jgi:hypothetical protein
MSDVRCISRPDRPSFAPGDGLPRGHSKAAQDARQNLGDFLDVVLMRPLHATNDQRQEQISEALETMTLTERVFLEVEMTARSPAFHSFEYDALR